MNIKGGVVQSGCFCTGSSYPAHACAAGVKQYPGTVIVFEKDLLTHACTKMISTQKTITS